MEMLRGSPLNNSGLFGLVSYTLPETNVAPENGWLEYTTFLLGSRPIFRGYVSFREGNDPLVDGEGGRLNTSYLIQPSGRSTPATPTAGGSFAQRAHACLLDLRI